MSLEQRPRFTVELRFFVVIGLGVGAGMVACRGAEKLLAPRLGDWGSFGVGLLAGVVVAAVVSLLVSHVVGLCGAEG